MPVEEKKGGGGAGVVNGDLVERVASEKKGASVSVPKKEAGRRALADEVVAEVDLGSVVFIAFSYGLRVLLRRERRTLPRIFLTVRRSAPRNRRRK